MFLNFFFNIFAIKIQMIEIDKKLHKDIKEYCQLNGLIMKDFVNKLLKKAFTIEKYGDKPFAEPKISNLEKEAIEKIKDMVKCQVDLPIEIAGAMEEVDFFELLGNEENKVQAILPVDYETPEPIKPILPTDYETPEPVETVLDISKKKVPNNFYGTIQYDESWEKKFEENIKNGSIITMPYVVETNGTMIVVNHSKKEKTSETTDTISSTEEKEEPKIVKKSKKRKLS